jgi:Tfp pilus assembly protein PilF
MIHKTLPFLFLLGCSTHEGPGATGNGARATPEHPGAARLAEAEALLREGEVDEALSITDELLKADSGDRGARLLAARGNIALVRSGRQGADWFLDDAVRQLEQALNQEPDDPAAILLLGWCRQQKSEFDSARDLAFQAADLLRERAAPPAEVGAALLQAADAQMQVFVAARRAELAAGAERPDASVVKLANQVLATLKTAADQKVAGSAHVRSSRVYQWLGRTNEALQELETAIRLEPTGAEAHDALQNLYWGMDMRSECVAAYKRLAKEAPGSTALQWYLGRAQVALGDDLRGKTQWDKAAAAYEAARSTFAAYDKARPGDRIGTGQWLAICELSLGRIAFERGDFEQSRRHYFAAFDASPAVAERDAQGMPKVYDSFGGNYLGGLSLIGQALAEQTDAGALRRSLEFFEAILAKHPERFGTIYNNAGLSARDLGVHIASSGEAAGNSANEASTGEAVRRAALTEAMQLWEQSYAYYQQAVALEPEDPRIANDCGLMLIYYLHRDYDRARALCETAIELGDAQLAALPEDADPARRQFLEEAVGDAWQNIGVLLQDRLDRGADEWKPCYEKALAYYPHQRREAAARLRALDSQARQQDPRKKKFDLEIEKGRKAAAEGDYDTALLVIDGLAKEMSGYAPFHHHAGIWSLAYAKKAAAEGGNPGLVEGLFEDAVRNLARAVELDGEPLQPRLELAEALLAKGDPAGAAATATDLLSHARSVGGADADFLVRTHAIRAEAAARAFVAAKQAGTTDEELLRAMRASFREIEASPAFDLQKRNLWVATEQWAGAPEQAVQVMVRAWERDPNLVGELVQTGASAGASQPVIDALAEAEDATTLWWRGRAHFDLGVQLWSAGKAKDGVPMFDRGIALFERSMRENPAFEDSCAQWIALSLGQKGIVQLSLDDLDGAETSLLTAVEKRADVFAADLGGGSSIRRGVLVLADRFLQKSDLGRCAAIYRRVGAAVPDDVDVANNEGLFCRDHADRLGGRRSAELSPERRDLYEASYAAYTRAAELDPQNVRLRNDRALILVYSLKRDLELAERILKSAIADGQRQIDEDPPEDAKELRDLNEAVGDAYGNLGVLYIDQKRYPEARQVLEKSLGYHPFQNRAGVGLLKRLETLEKDGDGRNEASQPQDGR